MCVLQVIQLCFIVACMYTGVGLLRLGFMVRFLSHSVITGFTSGMQFLQTVKHTTAATASTATTTCSSPRNRDMWEWHPEPACTWPGYVASIHVNLRVASWPLLHGVVGLHSILAQHLLSLTTWRWVSVQVRRSSSACPRCATSWATGFHARTPSTSRSQC